MKFKLTYLVALALAVTACTNDDDTFNTLSGNSEKTPLTFSAALDNRAQISRAAGDEGFAESAKLHVYLRHTTGEKDANNVYPVTPADQAPRLVTLTCNSAGTPVTDFTASYTNTAGGTTSKLYWDDFSNSNSADTDLRTTGHGLQSYYGYSGIEASEITEATGVITHSVATDQSSEVSTDLLWSGEQVPVIYAHADKNDGGDHRTVNLPFSHALSKVTINVIAGEGFEAGCLANTKVQIEDFNTAGTFTAPSQKIEATASANIKLNAGEAKTIDSKPTRAYTAMTIPHTNLTIGNTLATITDVNGNDYNIPVTQGIIKVWSEKLDESVEDIDNGIAQAKPHSAISRSSSLEPGKGWITKPGVNYVLNVTVSKTKITLSATLKDWDYVYANAEGKIIFAGDVTETGSIATELQANGFDVYKNTANDGFTTKSTTATYADSKWSYSPVIYWQNKDDNEYFRAISPAGTTLSSLAQGIDYLWGTSGDDAISPRTGDVHLDFDHAMSKITVNLETAEGDASLATSPAVNLTGAKIEISNLSTSGSINLTTGDITPITPVTVDAIPQATAISNLAVIPQSIGDTAIMKITLADGTTYRLQLNQCVDTNSSDEPKPAITKWLRGKSYTYTIHIEKEAITFRAMIKNWEETSGSGNANLEWD